MDFDPLDLTIETALTAMQSGDLSAMALTEACLRHTAQLNPALNAFLTLTPEALIQAAMNADSILSLRPGNLKDLKLLGIPIAVKDLIDTAGIRTTAGTKFFAENIPVEDAEVVLRLKVAGAGILGKTNTHEIALGVTGVNPHYGAVKNPWNTENMTGGSSSGSAVAVATGMCPAALGTDTGGSIRIPASLCGVVGFKPTFGRISTRGVIPLSWTLDHVGIITRCVKDAAILLQVLAGFDPHDPASVDLPVEDSLLHLEDGLQRYRIAQAVGEYVEACDEHVWAGVQGVGLAMKALGASLEKVDMSWLAELAQANSCITQAEAAAIHHDRLAEHPDWFGEDVRTRLETGARFTSTEYALARRKQVEARRRFEMFFTKYDLLVLPTTPITAPRLDGMQAIEASRQLTRFTSPFNLGGVPVISMPAGWTGGLPFGVQLVGAHWKEGRLLQAARGYEQAISGDKPVD